jgi:hypothetical protein
MYVRQKRLQKIVASLCESQNTRVADAEKCLHKIYHTTSKHQHGVVSEQITIRFKDVQAPGDRVALASLFTWGCVPFSTVLESSDKDLSGPGSPLYVDITSL